MWRKKRLKKRTFNILIILPVIVILLISILLFIFIKAKILVIKEIEIGNNQVACAQKDQIKDVVSLYGQNYFWLDSKKVEEKIKEKFFCIKSILISKHFPSKIKVEVFSRQPLAILLTLKEKEASPSSLEQVIATPSAELINDTYLIDNEGVIFAKSAGEINIPKIYIYDPEAALGKKLENDLVNNSLKILEGIKKFGMEVSESWISDNSFIIKSNTSGFKIIFSLGEKIDIQLASLQLILDKAKIDLKEPEFIDLRFDRPIVRFAPKEDNGKR